MRQNNPVHRPGVIEKIKISMKGKKLALRRGNGWGPTKWQTELYEKLKTLGLNPKMELAVGMGGFQPEEQPMNAQTPPSEIMPRVKCYRMDIGLVEYKLAIEVDGNSHRTLQQKTRDSWKTRRLKELGWIVLRFWNSQVTEHLEDCAQTVLSTISKLRETTITSPTAS
jgi:hypothetical protein